MQKVSNSMALTNQNKRFTYWKVLPSKHDDSTQWSWRLYLWRFTLELFVYRHEYYDFPSCPPKRKKGSPDRWVFQPCLIYDRKRI